MSSAGALNTILSTLDHLTPADLTKVRNKTRVLLSLSGSSSDVSSYDFDEDYLADGIVRELQQRRLISQNATRESLKYHLKEFPEYARASIEVRALFDTHLPPNLAYNEKSAFGWIVAEALAAYLESWSKPKQVSDWTLMRYISEAPAALDRAYPGYLKSGMLFMLIRCK